MITCELDLISTPFCDTTVLTHEVELPASGKKVGSNILDDEYFTIPYIADTIPNSPDTHKFSTQAKQNVWIIVINVEYHIIDQDAINELNIHQNTHGKSKVKISVCRMKSYQITDLEEICSRFDQVGPMV